MDVAAPSLLSAQRCAAVAAAAVAEEFDVCGYGVWDLRRRRGKGEESRGVGWDDVSRQLFSMASPIPVPSLPTPQVTPARSPAETQGSQSALTPSACALLSLSLDSVSAPCRDFPLPT